MSFKFKIRPALKKSLFETMDQVTKATAKSLQEEIDREILADLTRQYRAILKETHAKKAAKAKKTTTEARS